MNARLDILVPATVRMDVVLELLIHANSICVEMVEPVCPVDHLIRVPVRRDTIYHTVPQAQLLTVVPEIHVKMEALV